MSIRSTPRHGRLVLAGILALLLPSLPAGTPLVGAPVEAVTLHDPRFERPRDASGLEARLDALIDECPGRPSILVFLPEREGVVERDGHRIVRAASLIKLPILAAIVSLCRRGAGSLDEEILLLEEDRTGGSGSLQHASFHRLRTVRELAERMIIESDNTATNALIRRFGLASIDAEFRRMGLVATRLERRILESREDNPVTAAEMAALLRDLNDAASTRFDLPAEDRALMISMLERATGRQRLGRFLPAETTLAHKTGTLRGVVHDAGIIDTPRGPVIVSALIDGAESRERAEAWLGRLGRLLYAPSTVKP